MDLCKLPVPGRPTIWTIVGQGPTALAVGAGAGFLDIFILLYPFASLSQAARYRLKYCLKEPLNQTNQISSRGHSRTHLLCYNKHSATTEKYTRFISLN